jgi:hypothetical protein
LEKAEEETIDMMTEPLIAEATDLRCAQTRANTDAEEGVSHSRIRRVATTRAGGVRAKQRC